MASILQSPASKTSLAVGFLYSYGLPSLSICVVPFHSNLSQSMVYEISKDRILKYWSEIKITHTEDWEEIELLPFKRARNRTTVHMSHFINICISNTLSNMTILQQQRHASTNLCMFCGLVTEITQHIYQCTHKGICDISTASVDTLHKWLDKQNTDPNINTLFKNTLVYIAEEGNDLPQCPNLALHYDILRIG